MTGDPSQAPGQAKLVLLKAAGRRIFLDKMPCPRGGLRGCALKNLLKILPGPQPVYVRYGVTSLLVLLMFGLRLGMHERTGLYAFILYIPAVVASALLFDRGTGYFAVLLSAALIATTLIWAPDRTEYHISALVSFALIAGGLAFISEGLRRALERAEAAGEEP